MKTLLLAVFGIFLAGAATGQETPIRIVVGFPPGGGSDLIARLVAEPLKAAFGAPAVVENRPGNGGYIAAEALKNAAPDGRTLMVSPIAVTVFGPLTSSRLRFVPARDFAPVSLAAGYDLALAVGPGTPAKTLHEYVAWVRADPAKGTFGVPTLGGPPFFFGVMLAQATGLELVSVPYKGGAPLLTDLIGGQVPAAITSLADFSKLYEAGKLRLLATSGSKRSLLAPEVPTFRELGFAGIEGSGWQAFHTRAGTPRPTIDRLSGVVSSALRKPEIRQKLLAIGLEPVGSTADELERRMAEDVARWAPVVKASGFQVDP